MSHPLRALRALLWASLLALGGVAQAQTPLAVPPLSARVIDQAQALKADERQALEDRLAGYEQAHGTQIVVLMVPSTNGEPIEDFANRVGSTWKIGRKGVGDGLLILLAVNDKRSRIEVARALEGAVPDLAAKRILRETMGPRFAKGDFAGGLNAGLDQITKLLEGESLPPLRGTQQSQKAPAADNNDIESLLVMLLIGVIVGGSVLKSMFGRGLGALLSGGAAGVITWFVVNSIIFGGIAGVVAFIFVLIMGSSGSGGRGYGGPVIWGGGGGGRSSGGGGGFSSGGGGDFAGGGASDSWGGND